MPIEENPEGSLASLVMCHAIRGKRSLEAVQNSRKKQAVCETEHKEHNMFCPILEV